MGDSQTNNDNDLQPLDDDEATSANSDSNNSPTPSAKPAPLNSTSNPTNGNSIADDASSRNALLQQRFRHRIAGGKVHTLKVIRFAECQDGEDFFEVVWEDEPLPQTVEKLSATMIRQFMQASKKLEMSWKPPT